MPLHQGIFRPRHPEKYKGDSSNIVYRSGWELRYMSFLDDNPNVLQWSSEEEVIPYRSPVDGKLHRYFPDFLVKMKNKQGVIETVLVEIKPKSQTQEPVQNKNINKTNKRRFLQEVMTWGVNQAKWRAAQEYCKDRKWRFIILTEDNLNIK